MIEQKAKLQDLRLRLANLPEAERQTIAQRGCVATVEGRVLSLHNTLLVYIQGGGTVVGGYRQWQSAGKQVKRGEHGKTILFPVGPEKEDGMVEAQRFYAATVFDISHVEERNGTAN